MHRDHKLALALALLLIGIAAALCFPRQQPADLADLELEDVEQLDAAIDQLPVRVYTESHQRPAEDPEPAEAANPVASNPLLRDPFADFPLLPAAPDPIPLVDVSQPAEVPTADPARSIQVQPWLDSVPSRPATVEQQTGPGTAEKRDNPEPPRLYEVQPGDTLSGLAVRFLGSTRRYLELYEANRDVLSSPDDLQVGMRLIIPRAGTSENGDEVRVAQSAEADAETVAPADANDEPVPTTETDEPAEESRFRPARTPFSRRFESDRSGGLPN